MTSTQRQYVRLLRVISLLVVALVLGFSVMQSIKAETVVDAGPLTHPGSITQADRLLAENDCWTGEAPADVEVPGHVVVEQGGETVYGGSVLVGKALGQLFEGQDHGLVVKGFCR